MATYTVIEDSAPYYTVRVEFADKAFEQTIVSVKEGTALATQLQEYADHYEVEWLT